jgi:hypothetical protein
MTMYGALAMVRTGLETALRENYLVPLVLAVALAYDLGATDDDFRLVLDMPFEDAA